MFDATSSNMQGRTSIYLDKYNYTVRYNLNLVYAYLRLTDFNKYVIILPTKKLYKYKNFLVKYIDKLYFVRYNNGVVKERK